ncbi:unnamed protein product [Clonostachys solani]|uniref:Major facilitator superfamily (MFS) profile domain-containing protein n=1 Tax=Clonostachys solani TaxID=160281 RepID=A0A9N9Z9T8_9HYPO|nr:unnamed protein product [Clonostachys solani]
MIGWKDLLPRTRSGDSTRQPMHVKWRSSDTFALATVTAAVFTDMFLYGVIVPILPYALTTRSGVAGDDAIFAYMADRLSSRRTPLLVGLVALAGGTVMLCVGNSVTLLVIGRILQGASAADVWAVGLALLNDTVGSKRIGHAFGYIGLGMSAANLLSPLLGGVVYEHAGYIAAYFIPFALIGVDIVFRLLLIERRDTPQRMVSDNNPNLDSDHATSKPCGMTTPTTIDISDCHRPNQAIQESLARSPPVPTRRERSGMYGMLYMLTSKHILVALAGNLIGGLLFSAFDAVLPLFVSESFEWKSTNAGLVFLPLVLPSALGPLIGKTVDRYGSKWVVTAGFITFAAFVIPLRAVTENTLGHKVLLCALLTGIGCSIPLMLPPLMADVAKSLTIEEERDPDRYGSVGPYSRGFALLNMFYSCGNILGPVIAGLVKELAGWKVETLAMGIVALVTAPLMAALVGGNLL